MALMLLHDLKGTNEKAGRTPLNARVSTRSLTSLVD